MFHAPFFFLRRNKMFFHIKRLFLFCKSSRFTFVCWTLCYATAICCLCVREMSTHRRTSIYMYCTHSSQRWYRFGWAKYSADINITKTVCGKRKVPIFIESSLNVNMYANYDIILSWSATNNNRKVFEILGSCSGRSIKHSINIQRMLLAHRSSLKVFINCMFVLYKPSIAIANTVIRKLRIYIIGKICQNWIWNANDVNVHIQVCFR